MIIAIHQPNFLPWFGYFHKMAQADRFVLLDSVAFTKGGYTNRVKVKAAGGAQWLTVPVLTKGKLGQIVAEVACSDGVDWRKKVRAALETNYRGCPHFQPAAGKIFGVLGSSRENLAEMNIRLIECVAGELGITTPMIRSSRIPASGQATQLLIAICQELGADTYLSGRGGLKYQEDEAFRAARIDLRVDSFEHPRYPQAFGEFTAGLSIVDLLFNCGPGSARVLGV